MGSEIDKQDMQGRDASESKLLPVFTYFLVKRLICVVSLMKQVYWKRWRPIVMTIW